MAFCRIHAAGYFRTRSTAEYVRPPVTSRPIDSDCPMVSDPLRVLRHIGASSGFVRRHSSVFPSHAVSVSGMFALLQRDWVDQYVAVAVIALMFIDSSSNTWLWLRMNRSGPYQRPSSATGNTVTCLSDCSVLVGVV